MPRQLAAPGAYAQHGLGRGAFVSRAADVATLLLLVGCGFVWERLAPGAHRAPLWYLTPLGVWSYFGPLLLLLRDEGSRTIPPRDELQPGPESSHASLAREFLRWWPEGLHGFVLSWTVAFFATWPHLLGIGAVPQRIPVLYGSEVLAMALSITWGAIPIRAAAFLVRSYPASPRDWLALVVLAEFVGPLLLWGWLLSFPISPGSAAGNPLLKVIGPLLASRIWMAAVVLWAWIQLQINGVRGQPGRPLLASLEETAIACARVLTPANHLLRKQATAPVWMRAWAVLLPMSLVLPALPWRWAPPLGKSIAAYAVLCLLWEAMATPARLRRSGILRDLSLTTATAGDQLAWLLGPYFSRASVCCVLVWAASVWRETNVTGPPSIPWSYVPVGLLLPLLGALLALAVMTECAYAESAMPRALLALARRMGLAVLATILSGVVLHLLLSFAGNYLGYDLTSSSTRRLRDNLDSLYLCVVLSTPLLFAWMFCSPQRLCLLFNDRVLGERNQ